MEQFPWVRGFLNKFLFSKGKEKRATIILFQVFPIG